MFTDWPQDNVLTLPSPKPSKEANVTMLGVSENLKWQVLDKGMSVYLPILPPGALPVEVAWAVRLEGVK